MSVVDVNPVADLCEPVHPLRSPHRYAGATMAGLVRRDLLTKDLWGNLRGSVGLAEHVDADVALGWGCSSTPNALQQRI